ncbi:hypothetical protein ACKWTF_006205 [Chironomus riparius]
MMHSVYLSFAFKISILIIVSQFNESNAKPFINPFNIAIKTNFAEDGNILTFVYPKKSYQFSFKMNSEEISSNNFDFSGFISFLFQKIGRKLSFLNPFKLSSSLPTTTESRLDFSNEVTDDYESSSEKVPSSPEEEDNSSNEASESPDENENSSTENIGSTTESEATTRSESISYLPPISIPSSLYELPKLD